MPKVRVSPQEEKNRRVRAYIAKNMELNGVNEAKAAIIIRTSLQTFKNKMERPETFKLGELQQLCKVLKVSPEDKAEIL